MTNEFTFREIASDVDPNAPLVYMWEIRDERGERVTCYVGKSSKGAKRPRTAYKRNVDRLRVGLPWHGNPVRAAYSPIHLQMSKAITDGHEVTLTFLCNSTLSQAQQREAL